MTVVNGGSIGGGGTGNLAEAETTDVGIARVIYTAEPGFRPLAADLVSIDPGQRLGDRAPRAAGRVIGAAS